jgi:hypothetical protein
MRPVTPRAILGSAAVALCLGLALVTLLQGFSASYPLRLVQGVSLFAAGALVLGLPLIWLALRMADWRDPVSEREFERIVERSERLARDDLAVEPDEGEFLELDPYDDAEFEELVRDALDELPDWAQRAAGRLRALPRRRRGPRHHGRPHRRLPRHAAPRLRPRSRRAARPGGAHGPPRARPPPGLERAGRARPGAVS